MNLVLDNWTEAIWRETVLLYGAQLPLNQLEAVIQAANDQGSEAAQLAELCLREYPRPEKLSPELLGRLATLKTMTTSAKYQTLEELLQAGKWREADQETYQLMITTVGKEVGQQFDPKDLREFPCEDLRELDRLWVKHGQGKFGFSVQTQIWQKCKRPISGRGKDWILFLTEVGWTKSDGSHKEYENLKADPLMSPAGEFPNFMVYSPGPRLLPLATFIRDMKEIYSRAETCKL